MHRVVYTYLYIRQRLYRIRSLILCFENECEKVTITFRQQSLKQLSSSKYTPKMYIVFSSFATLVRYHDPEQSLFYGLIIILIWEPFKISYLITSNILYVMLIRIWCLLLYDGI